MELLGRSFCITYPVWQRDESKITLRFMGSLTTPCVLPPLRLSVDWAIQGYMRLVMGWVGESGKYSFGLYMDVESFSM